METVVALVNDYHNVGKEISKIMEEKCLSHFQVISAICDYTFKRMWFNYFSLFLTLCVLSVFIKTDQCTIITKTVLTAIFSILSLFLEFLHRFFKQLKMFNFC